MEELLNKTRDKPPRINLIGLTFGHLTIIDYAGINKHRQNMWKCRCSCGNIVVVATSTLKSGHTKSCGCLKRSKK